MNITKMVLAIGEKYETLSIYLPHIDGVKFNYFTIFKVLVKSILEVNHVWWS